MSAAPILTILRNGETLRSLPIEGEAVLGRAEGCVIRLEDRAISRSHAVFKAVEGGVQVERKSEFAPLLVNGAEVGTRAIVKEADVISIGPYLLRVTLPKPVQPAAPAQAQSGAPSEGADAGGAGPSEGAAAEGLEPQDAPVEGQQDAFGEGLDASAEPAAGGLTGLELGAEGAESRDASASPGFDPAPAAFDNGLEGMGGAGLGGELEIETADDDARTKLTPAAKVSVRLVFPPGAANVTEFEITKDEISIGRGKGCDIILNDKKASRKNAIIRRAGLSFTIKDLDSANGTYVNGARVAEQELSGEDVIVVGGTEFQFKAVSADYAVREQGFMPVPEEAVEEAPADPGLGFGDPMADPAQALAVPGAADPAAIPGMPGAAGIPGMGAPDVKRMGFVEKIRNFKSLPKKDRFMVIVIVGGLLYFALDTFGPEEKPAKKAPAKRPAAAASATPGTVTFESLSPEKQRFVEAQRNLAFEHFKNKEYDKALYELDKIFALIQDYKDARDIQRFAREGKRKLEALEEEKRKKEEEQRLKAKIQSLVEECGQRMRDKHYEQARELFAQISVLDPDNAQVTAWQKELQDLEERKRLAEQEEQVQAEINKRAWEVYQEGLGLKKQGRFHSAIEVFGKVPDIGASDRKVVALAVKQIKSCKHAIQARRDPVLAEAKQAEAAGELPKAFELYRKATKIDPPHREGYAGMQRIRGILHERAKAIYTEAILAESYSDFAVAKRKFKECQEVAPQDDIYHERAARKLARYFKAGKEDATP